MPADERLWLTIADQFFLWFHGGLVLFNCLGWIWRPTRVAHLVSVGLTAASWFLLGIFYGIGYCPLTDWHFGVLQRLGEDDLPRSYLTYLVRRITGLNPAPRLVEVTTVLGLVAAAGAALVMRARKSRRVE